MIAGTIRNAVNQMQLVNDWKQKKATGNVVKKQEGMTCLLYTSPSPRDQA